MLTADDRRRQWRCRRGLLELDYILLRFFDRGYGKLDREERLLFERLLLLPDNELLAVLEHRRPVPDQELKYIVEKIT